MLVIHVRDRAIADLAAASLERSEQTIVVDDALSSSFRGLAAREEAGGTTILSAAPEYLALVDRVVEGTGAEVVALLAEDVSDTYGWFVHSPTLRRRFVQQEGRSVDSDGDATPEETGVEALDEDTLFEMLERRTGISLPWDDDAQAILLVPGAAPRRRRRWFRR